MVGLVLALLPFLGLMTFAQPAIDDYDNAAVVARLGYGGGNGIGTRIGRAGLWPLGFPRC